MYDHVRWEANINSEVNKRHVCIGGKEEMKDKQGHESYIKDLHA